MPLSLTQGPIYTRFLMEHYYVYRTRQKCKECGAISAGHMASKMFVYATNDKGDSVNYPVEEILARFMHHLNLTEEAAKWHMPELPVFIKDHIIDVNACDNCLVTSFGNESVTHAMLPAAPIGKLHAVTSPNLEAHNPHKNRPSKKIKPRKVNVATGPIDNLLKGL